MTSNREQTARGAARRRRTQPDQETHLERRRAEMHAAEGHAGSIPRGNQEPEQGDLGRRRHEWDRVLGH
ncbi:MAG TPA: hypothetical protein VIZ91_11530 [Solirubrobacterales bacterium]